MWLWPGADERRKPMLAGNAFSPTSAQSVSMQAQAAAFDKMTPAYDLVINSAALMGGFAISAALGSIQEDDFGNQASFDAYAVLLVISSILDIYAVVSLVFNRYISLRIFELTADDLRCLDACGESASSATHELAQMQRRKEHLHVVFLRRSRRYRDSAVWAFGLSLPCFLGVLAARQFSVQPMRTPPIGYLLASIEPFTPIRWVLASLVFAGMFAVLVAILGQLLLRRRVARG